MKSKLPFPLLLPLVICALTAPLYSLSGDSCGMPNNPDDDPPAPASCPNDTGNSSNGDRGPLTHAPTSNSGKSPDTGQTFISPNGSNGWNTALDLEIHRQIGEIPFEFRRTYQSRIKSGLGEEFGHGLTWGHNYAWRMSAGNGKHAITFPDGRVFLMSKAGNIQFDGVSQILHLPDQGRGERVYQGGVGDNRFTLVMPDSKRHVFDRVSNPDNTSTFHPRFSQDSAGRKIEYTSDDQGRIISATDATGSTISLEYGPIQVNRKASVLLHKVASAPAADWNEIILTTPQPFRWFQALSANNSFFNLAEIEFYAPDGSGGHTRLPGSAYGTGPAHRRAQGETFDKAFDGDVTTGYYHARPGGGIAGLDLGAGNESHVSKIRYRPRTSGTGSEPMYKHSGLRFEAVTEAPEIIEVLQRVTCSDGRAVNYLYDTIVDESIGQTHLVLSGVDYDGDMFADSDTDARFTYVFSNPGRGPSVETFHEPRTHHSVPDLKFEYRSTLTATHGMVGKVIEATTGEVIFENTPKLARRLDFPGGRGIEVLYDSAGNVDRVINAEGNPVIHTYDANGFIASTTDEGGRTTTYTHNFRGQRTSVTSPEGVTQTILYDPATARMIGMISSAPGYPDRTTTWTRDAGGLVTRKDYPDSSYETYAYNASGLVTAKRERNGSITSRTYDATGLCLTFTRAAGTPVEEPSHTPSTETTTRPAPRRAS